MIRITKQVAPILEAPGSFVKRSLQFYSTEDLRGKNLNIDIGMYVDSAVPYKTGTAFVAQYPASGNVTFTPNRNWKLILEVLDARNFILHYSFFVTKNYFGFLSQSRVRPNDAFFVNEDINGGIYFLLSSISSNPKNQNTGEFRLPVQISASCKKPLTFSFKSDGLDLFNSYIFDKDLEIDLSMNDSVGNNFYVGWYREDAIVNNIDIVKALGLQYAMVNSSTNYVDMDIPKDVFAQCLPFKNINDKSLAIVKIDKDFLQRNATYRLLVVYQVGGTWYSCVSPQITESIAQRPLELLFTDEIGDGFGQTAAQSCAKGLLKGRKISICTTPNKSNFNTQLTDRLIGGTFDSRLAYVNSFLANSSTALSGVTINHTVTGDEYCIEYEHSSQSDFVAVVFEFGFNMNGYREKHFKVFELSFNNTIDSEEPELYNPSNVLTKVICDEVVGNYLVDNLMTGCDTKLSINGGEYIESNIISGKNVNSALLKLGEKVCILQECSGTPSTISGGGSEPEKCYKNRYKLRAWTPCTGVGFQLIYILNGSVTNQTVASDTVFEVESDFNISVISVQIASGCNVTIENTSEKEEVSCDRLVSIDRENFAAINYVVDEETETVTLSKVTSFSATLDTEEYLVSFDGINFIDAPSSVTGEEKVYVVYIATFTDGSPPVQIEQVINVPKLIECNNEREIELTIVDGQLIIDITTTFESDLVTDELVISKDDFVTFTKVDLLTDTPEPINLEGGELYKVYTYTTFEKDCEDLVIEEEIQVPDDIESVECNGDYAAYGIELEYDTEMSTFEATFTGDREELEVDIPLWTIDRGNPFDVNNTGVPYIGPIMGAGQMILRWKIKLENCPPKFIDAYVYGTRQTEIKLPPIDVRLPPGPIQFCEVVCCTANNYIECIDLELTILGDDLTGFDITWVGPGGFTGTGNPITIPNVTGEYTATISAVGCTNSVSYYHNKPEAGNPTDTIIIVQ